MRFRFRTKLKQNAITQTAVVTLIYLKAEAARDVDVQRAMGDGKRQI